MLAEPIDAPSKTSPAELLGAYESDLADVVETVGVERAHEATGLDRSVLESVEGGDAADLEVDDAAAILALQDGAPATDAILAEVRDHLLLGMSSAMLTVEHIAADVDGNLDPKEIQGMVEGRHPMSLAQFARINHYIAGAQ